MTHRRFGMVGWMVFVAGSSLAVAAKVETWRLDSASSLAKAKKERVVVSDTGNVRLGRALTQVGSMTAGRVWDIVRTPQGVVFAATGDEGKVYRLKEDVWELAFDAGDSQALSLACLPNGRTFVGTGPSGAVVELGDPKHPATRPDPGVQYIWDLAADSAGNLYAATGPNGGLWKRNTRGDWSLLLDSKHSHLLCVALGPDGSVYAGSDGEGLIYRVAPDGRTSVVYDAPQAEIRSLLAAPDGTIYAGTAGEASGGSGSGRPSSLFSSPSSSFGGGGRGSETSAGPKIDVPRGTDSKVERTSTAGGTALPKPVSSGENAVYRIGVDGVAREVFRAKALIHAMAWQKDRLLIGTGPDGRLFELRDGDRESTPLARLDSGQVLALANDADGGLLIGTGDPGAVVRLASGYVPAGTLTSDVLDAKLISRFGSIGWKADVPTGSSLAVQVRTGNVGEPDATWSPWSSEQVDPTDAKAGTPLGRFAQYRAVLRTDDPAKTPELRSIAIRYQTINIAPEITKLDVPDVGSSDGATKASKLSIKWDATDPNGDDLAYTLQLKKEGWPDWIKLGENPITETKYEWDASAMPSGTYRIQLVASDRPSNRPDDALARTKESEPFLVDHGAPAVGLIRNAEGKIIVSLKDDAVRLTKAAYAVDGGEWVAIFPDDGLFDTKSESITLKLSDFKPGSHLLMVRAYDAAGNVGTGDLVLVVP